MRVTPRVAAKLGLSVLVAGIVMPLLGCSGSDKPEVPKNSSYYTGPLTEKPKGSMTPRSGMVGSEK